MSTALGRRLETHLSFAGLFVVVSSVVGGALERREGLAGALVLAGADVSSAVTGTALVAAFANDCARMPAESSAPKIYR